MGGTIYMLQPSFVGGEISTDIASRIDLEKFSMALLKAENAIIKPYGNVSRRPGTVYKCETKYADKKSILVKFNYTVEKAFMLEVGDRYIRVLEDGTTTLTELATPFTEADLKYLRFTQSADTMYICSQEYPVQVLKRTKDMQWIINNFEEDHPYFDMSNNNIVKYGAEFKTSGAFTFRPRFSGRYRLELVGAGGGGYKGRVNGGFISFDERFSGGNGEKKVLDIDLVANEEYEGMVGGGGACGQMSVPVQSGGASSFSTYIANGGGGAGANYNGANAGNALGGVGGYWYKSGGNALIPELTAVNGGNGYVLISYAGNNSISTSAKEGLAIDIKAKLDTFKEEQVGSYIKLSHDLPSSTVSVTNGTSASLMVGQGWKLITHGIWHGSVMVERSTDLAAWTEFRKYTSAGDFNAQESGTFTEYTHLRIRMIITSGACTGDLTALPYKHDGFAKIIEYVSPTDIKANVIEPFGSTDSTEQFAFSVWSDLNGYPACSCFFQDRLLFAANKLYPYMIWMSRSGDYYNFKVEKVEGTITDDSAVALSVISREEFKINHLVPAQDLVILTNGNEWIVSGSTVITPTNSKAVMQSSRGSNECEPSFVGNRTIYVQRRGGTVRDMGYTFESDNYSGDDLTQLARHLVEGYDIVDSTFAQEPNSIIYMVRTDGTLLLLTYIREQKVYAWSTIKTDGEFESVVNIPGDGDDNIYVVVKRIINDKTVRYIEMFTQQQNSENIKDYIMCDCSKVLSSETDIVDIDGLEHLNGKEIQIVGDGRLLPSCIVTDGHITLVTPCKHVVLGLKYTTHIEQPNFEIQLKDGTMQGRKKNVVETTLRLRNSLGGKIGQKESFIDDIVYDEFLTTAAYPLFSGDKICTMPSSFNDQARVYILHDQPFPFNISAIVRKVDLGG